MSPRRWYSHLYLQVLVAIGLGILVGHLSPKTGISLRPLGDGFVALIRMMIGPVVFCTVVQGIGSMSDLKKVGRIGIKALLYFEIVSTIALGVGMLVAHLLHPGAGLNIEASNFDTTAVSTYVSHAKQIGIVGWLEAIIPQTFVSAFVNGDVLQILLISVLTGFAISSLGDKSHRFGREGGICDHPHHRESSSCRGIWCHRLYGREV